MTKIISGIFDRFFVLCFSLLFLQIPLFMQQYHHQLVGHVNELSLQVEAIRRAATESQKTLDQFIQKFIQSSDIDFAKQGQIMSNMVSRWHELSDSLTAMHNASLWMRPLVFIRYLNLDIAYSTAQTFQFGVAFSIEGLLYAILGALSGYLFFKLLISFLSSFVLKFKQPAKQIH